MAIDLFLSSFTFNKALSSSSSKNPAHATSEKEITPVVDACALCEVAKASITKRSARSENLLERVGSLFFSPILNLVFSIITKSLKSSIDSISLRECRGIDLSKSLSSSTTTGFKENAS